MEKEYDDGQPSDTRTHQNDGSDSPEKTGKTINMSGKSFEVSEDLAQAFSDYNLGIDRRFSERSHELGMLRQFQNDVLTKQKEVETKKVEPVDLSTLMYEDPNKFVDTIKNEIKGEADRLRQEYKYAETVKKDEENFWSSIWEENKDLAKFKSQTTDVIKMIGQKYSNLNLQNTKPVRDALAKEARNWMAGIAGKSSDSNNDDGFVEGSSSHSFQSKTKTKDDDKPRPTTKQILESRREAKRKAMADRT